MMPTSSALAALPKEWQSWINENLARGCDPRDMAKIMVRDGHFDARLVQLAIDSARGVYTNTHNEVQESQPMPAIDTSANTVQTPDRVINGLFTLQIPHIVLLGNVLSDEECDELTQYGEQRLERSPVVSDGDGVSRVHVDRTSRGAMMQRGETALIARIEARLAALTAWPVDRGEGLQLLHYEKGNEYKPHFDWFDPDKPGPRRHLEQGGQRLATIIMYLSNVEQGGATSFPKLGLQVQPRKGCAVFFANTDPYGIPDQQTLHGGEPVEKGTKVIATKWLRYGRY